MTMSESQLTEGRVLPVAERRRGIWAVAAPRLPFAVLLVLALLYPFYFSDYSDFQMALIFSLAIAVLGLNLLTGFTGLISVGHGALMGVGAYTTIILAVKFGVPSPLGVVAAAVICFGLGLLLGIPSLRVSGLYLALMTLGFALIFPSLVTRFAGLTGGVDGLNHNPPDAPLGLPLSSAQWLYLVTLIALVAAMFAVRGLVNGRIGRALHSIQTNELMAAANGVRVARTKILVFAVSSVLAGVGGALYQLNLGPVIPDTYQLALSITLLTAAVVGGVRTVLGAVVGSAFVVYAPEYASGLGARGPQLIYAVSLLVVVYLFRSGVVGGLQRAWERVRPNLDVALAQVLRRTPTQLTQEEENDAN